MSSMLYEFTNKEQDKVFQGFRAGNFVSLRDLPDVIVPGNVSGMLSSKIEENLFSVMERRSWVELSSNGGFFSKFDWKPDSFGEFHESIMKDKKEWKEKHDEVHGEHSMFLYNPHRPKALPHNSEFQSAENITIGFLSQNDPYEANAFEILRAKWINDSKMLYGEFKCNKKGKSLGAVNKMNIPEMVGFIKKNLLTDWSDINFIIGSNPEDYIEIRLDNDSVDAPKGLHAYMNTMINTHDMMLKYRLRRIPEFWGLKSEDG